MKRVLIGLVLGFMLHKGLTGVYNYAWLKADLECIQSTTEVEEEFKCVNSKLGVLRPVLHFLLAAPHIDFGTDTIIWRFR